jgi:hypothetical protein
VIDIGAVVMLDHLVTRDSHRTRRSSRHGEGAAGVGQLQWIAERQPTISARCGR